MDGIIFKLKKDKELLWREWCDTLHTQLRVLAEATLDDENSDLEASFMFEINGDKYVLLADIGESLPSDKKYEINLKHQAMKKECFEEKIFLNKLYELKRGDKNLLTS